MLEQLHGHPNVVFGKEFGLSHGRKDVELPHNWKKGSIFFKLPYWHTFLLRHNLDVMRIEKNVCDNVLFTLLNIEGKTKDGVKARYDLKEMVSRKSFIHGTLKVVKQTYQPQPLQ